MLRLVYNNVSDIVMTRCLFNDVFTSATSQNRRLLSILLFGAEILSLPFTFCSLCLRSWSQVFLLPASLFGFHVHRELLVFLLLLLAFVHPRLLILQTIERFCTDRLCHISPFLIYSVFIFIYIYILKKKSERMKQEGFF